MNTLTHKNIYSFLPLPFSIGRDTKGIFNILKFQSIKMIKKMIYDVCLIIKQKNRIGVTFIFRLNQANTRLSCLILFPWFCIVLMFDKNFLLTTKLKNPRSLIRNKNKNYFYKLLKPIYFFFNKKVNKFGNFFTYRIWSMLWTCDKIATDQNHILEQSSSRLRGHFKKVAY